MAKLAAAHGGGWRKGKWGERSLEKLAAATELRICNSLSFLKKQKKTGSLVDVVVAASVASNQPQVIFVFVAVVVVAALRCVFAPFFVPWLASHVTLGLSAWPR